MAGQNPPLCGEICYKCIVAKAYPISLRTFPPNGTTVACAEKRDQMPNLHVHSRFIVERTREIILRAKETIRRSREILRTSKEIQDDRERSALSRESALSEMTDSD